MRTYVIILLAFLVVQIDIKAQDIKTEESGSFEDIRDLQTYKWVRIGSQIWMSQNLNFAVDKGPYCYDSDTSNCKIYGRLYDWSVAQKICPAGWHLPSHQEWKKVSDFLDDQVGEKMKEIGDAHWNGPDAVVRGESGFNAIAAGCKSIDPSGRTHFNGVRDFAYFWSSTTATPASKAWCRYISSTDDILHPFENWKEWGYSVRCVKD
jgi:uncharacterized protein (TIGR02145 family)